MTKNLKFSKLNFFEKISAHVTRIAGSNVGIIFSFVVVVIWFIGSVITHFAEQSVIVIHLVTAIITFLMVFIIQKSQNKDALAIQLKLNELVAANALASNRLVDVENMTEAELKIIQKYYAKLSAFASNEDNLQQSHSIDEIEVDHDIKRDMERELLGHELPLKGQ